MTQHATIGVVGAHMRYEDGSLQGSFGYRPTLWRELFQMALVYHFFPVGRVLLPSSYTARSFETSHQVSWVSGGLSVGHGIAGDVHGRQHEGIVSATGFLHAGVDEADLRDIDAGGFQRIQFERRWICEAEVLAAFRTTDVEIVVDGFDGGILGEVVPRRTGGVRALEFQSISVQRVTATDGVLNRVSTERVSGST